MEMEATMSGEADYAVPVSAVDNHCRIHRSRRSHTIAEWTTMDSLGAMAARDTSLQRLRNGSAVCRSTSPVGRIRSHNCTILQKNQAPRLVRAFAER